MENSDLTCRVLHQSRLYISEKGRWVKRQEHQPGNGGPDAYCAIGIVRRVATEYGCPWGSVLQRLKVALPDGFNSIPDYNDSSATKQEDIVRLFERAERGCA